MYMKQTGLKSVFWIGLAQDKENLRALLISVINMWAPQNTGSCGRISWRYISIRQCRPKEGNDLRCSCVILSLHCSFVYDQLSSTLSLFLYFLIFLFRCMCSVCSCSGCERRQIVATDVSTCVSVSWLDIKSKAYVSICCHLFTNMSNPYMWMETSRYRRKWKY